MVILDNVQIFSKSEDALLIKKEELSLWISFLFKIG